MLSEYEDALAEWPDYQPEASVNPEGVDLAAHPIPAGYALISKDDRARGKRSDWMYFSDTAGWMFVGTLGGTYENVTYIKPIVGGIV